MTGVVEVTRGGIGESRHRVHAAVVDASGRKIAQVGDASLVAFMRSAAKPFQAIPLVDDGAADALGITPEELALCCGSHNAEDAHLAGARSILARAGLDEGAIECGPHPPLRVERVKELYQDGTELTGVHNNCSGKHAGMLALATHRGWATVGYTEAGHPVQERVLSEIVRWTDLAEGDIATGVDGCGVVSFAMPLGAMAAAYGRFMEAAATEEGPRRVVEAMTTYPFQVAGTGRLCTTLMERTGDRIVVKTGAEGVYCAGVREGSLGVAVKVDDGSPRASGVALLRVLEELGVLDEDDMERLEAFARPVVTNTRGARVGRIRATFDVERC